MSGMSIRRGALAAAVLLAVALAGCGSTPATAKPTPTATPTPSPTPSPTPTASPSPSPTVDPAAQLSIAAPYSLEPLNAIAEAEFEAGIKAGIGQLGSVITVGARTVTKSGAPVAGSLVMVMDLGSGSAANMSIFFDSAVGGMATSMGGTISKSTILGHNVQMVTTKTSVVAAYPLKTAIVMALAPDAAEAKAIATALIQANP